MDAVGKGCVSIDLSEVSDGGSIDSKSRPHDSPGSVAYAGYELSRRSDSKRGMLSMLRTTHIGAAVASALSSPRHSKKSSPRRQSSSSVRNAPASSVKTTVVKEEPETTPRAASVNNVAVAFPAPTT